MHNFKLITYLKALSKPELNRFEKFVQSPYCNSKQQLHNLFKLIKPHFPSFTSPKLKREKVFAKLYPGQRFNDAKLRRLSTELVKLYEPFLIAEEINEFEDLTWGGCSPPWKSVAWRMTRPSSSPPTMATCWASTDSGTKCRSVNGRPASRWSFTVPVDLRPGGSARPCPRWMSCPPCWISR